ncbi:MAG: S24 family peptidase [Bythopirellula sp.]
MPDSPSDVLRRARIAKGYASAADAARHFQWSISSYTAHENGTRGIRPKAAKLYAEAFGVSPGRLLDIPAPTFAGGSMETNASVEVVGEAAWGVWREVEASGQEAGQVVRLPDDTSGCYALRMGDASLDREIVAGSLVFFEPVKKAPQLSVGQFVVVRRTRHDLSELTVQYVAEVDGDRVSLSGRSTQSRYDAVTTYDASNPGDIEIRGVVVGSYRSFS